MSASTVLTLPAFLETVASKLRHHESIHILGSLAVATKADVGHYLDRVAKSAHPSIPLRSNEKTTYRNLCKVATYLGLPAACFAKKDRMLYELEEAMQGKPNDAPPVAWEIARATRDATARINGAPTSGFVRNYDAEFEVLEGPLVTATDAKKNFVLTEKDLERTPVLNYVNRYGTPSRMFDLESVADLAYSKYGGELGVMVARELYARKRQRRADAKRVEEELAILARTEREREERRRRIGEIRVALSSIRGADVEYCISKWLLNSSSVEDVGSHPVYWLPSQHAARMLHKYHLVVKGLERFGGRYDRVLWIGFVIRNDDNTEDFAGLMREAEERHFFENFSRMDTISRLIYSSFSEQVDELEKEWRGNGGTGSTHTCATRAAALRDFVRVAGINRALEVVPAHLAGLANKIAGYGDARGTKRKR